MVTQVSSSKERSGERDERNKPSTEEKNTHQKPNNARITLKPNLSLS